MKKFIVHLLSLLACLVIEAVGIRKIEEVKIKESQKMSDKHLALFLMMTQWVKVKQEGKNLSTYFERKGYRVIAIYGMSYAGEALADELVESNIKIKYGIDQKENSIYAEFPIISPKSEMENVDAIIVTSITAFFEIEEQLSEKVHCPIISLEDILYEI